jgi:hypothetical protein
VREAQGDTRAGLCMEHMKEEMPGWVDMVTHLQACCYQETSL